MIQSPKTRLIFKTIAGLMACIFLWQQISWAGDLTENTLAKLNTDQSQTFTPAYLQNQQLIHEDLIAQKQALEDASSLQSLTAESVVTTTPEDSVADSLDLQGPKSAVSGAVAGGSTAPVMTINTETTAAQDDSAVLSVTTEAGDVIHYKANQIDSIDTKDSNGKKITIRRVEGLDLVDADNNLLNAEITYSDGTVQMVSAGKVTSRNLPDGTIYTYNSNEKISSILYPDSNTVSFTYDVVDADSSIVTVLTDSDKSSYYDTDNRLKRVVFNSGKIIEYNSGVISKVTESDLGQYIFDITTNPDNTLKSSLNKYIAPDGTTYNYILDEETSELREITLEKNGLAASYNKEGDLVKITKDGQIIDSALISQAQALVDSVVSLDNQIQAAEASLAQAQADLALAQAAEDAARTEYNNALADVAVKQAIYDAAVVDRQAKEAALSIAAANLTAATQAKTAAQNTLLTAGPAGSTRTYSYNVATDILTLNQSNPQFTKTYDNQGRVLTQNLNDGIYTTFTYTGADCSRKDYDAFNKVTPLWTMPSAQSYSVSGGKLYLSGTQGYPPTVMRQTLYDARSSNPNYGIDFSVNNPLPELLIGVEGYSAGVYRKFVIRGYEYFHINIEYTVGTTTTVLAMPISNYTVGATYRVVFQCVGDNINIYLWNKASTRPATPTYTLNTPGWDTKFLTSINVGMVTLDEFYLTKNTTSYTPDSNVQNMMNAIKAYNTAQADYNAALSAYNAAIIAETQARDNLTTAQQVLAEKEAVLNEKVAARQVLEATVADLNNQLAAYQSQFTDVYNQLKDIVNNGNDASIAELADKLSQIKTTFESFVSHDAVLANANSGIDITGIHYDLERRINKVRKMDASSIDYSDGLPVNVSDASGTTLYSYDLNGLNDSGKITVDRNGIKRVYDTSGNLESMSIDGISAEIELPEGVNEDLKLRLTDDSAILRAPVFGADGAIQDGTIEKLDSGGNIVYSSTYQAGKLVSYKDSNGNEFSYDGDGNLATLKKSIGDDKYVTYNYTQALITIAAVPEEDRGVLSNDAAILIKYENTDEIRRIIYIETKDGHYKDIKYIDGGYEVSEGVYAIVSGERLPIVEHVKKYDVDRYLVSDASGDGTVMSYEYSPLHKVSFVSVKKDSVTLSEYSYAYDGDKIYVTVGDVVYEYLSGVVIGVSKMIDGDLYQYVKKGSDSSALVLTSIVKGDGTLISNIVSNDIGIAENYDFNKDGVVYHVENGTVKTGILPDGTVIEYDVNGAAAAIIHPDGSKTDYSYSTLTSYQAEPDGSQQGVVFLTQDAVAAGLQDPADKLLLSLDGNSNATATIDSSLSNHNIAFNGDAHLSTTDPKFGTSSLSLDGNGDYVSISDSDDWNFTQYGEDVLIGGAITSSGDYVDKNYAFDNDASTYWESVGGGAGRWIEYDLGQGNAKAVQKLRILNAGATGSPTNNGIQGFILQGSNDDAAWTDVYQGTCPPESQWHDFTFNNQTAFRYYRLYSTSSYHPDAIIVKEVELLEAASSDFTIDFWAKLNALPATSGPQYAYTNLIGQASSATDGWWIGYLGGADGGDKRRLEVNINGQDVMSMPAVAPTLNEWFHVAWVRSGSQDTLYYNGVAVSADSRGIPTSNVASDLRIGYSPYGASSAGNAASANYLNGSIDGVRISKGLARWTSDFTPPQTGYAATNPSTILQLATYTDTNNALLLNLDGNNNATAALDSSLANHNVTFYGDAHLGTTDPKIGASSLSLDGSDDYISLADSPDWDIFADTTTSQTIDFWVNVTTDGTIFSQWPGVSGDGYVAFTYADNLYFQGFWGNSVAGLVNMSFGTITKNTWHHVAMVKTGGASVATWDGYLDGVGVAMGWTQTTTINNMAPLEIGRSVGWYGVPIGYFNGQIDGFRISEGITRWTSNFTPPTEQSYNPYKASGTFTSNAMQLNATELSALSWSEISPEGTNVTLQVRTGNTANPDDGSWSEWSAPSSDAVGSPIAATTNNYLQYRFTLSTNSADLSPKVVRRNFIDLADIYYVDANKNGVVSRYDAAGVNVADPQDVIDISRFVVNRAYLSTLVNGRFSLDDFIDASTKPLPATPVIDPLVDTIINIDPLLNLHPESDAAYDESTSTIRHGSTLETDLENVPGDEPVDINYEVTDNGGTKTTRTLSFIKKDGSATYYFYSDTGKKTVEDVKSSDGLATAYYIINSYDLNGAILETVYLYDDPALTKTVAYEGGRKKSITQGGKQIATYTYSEDYGGNEVTILKDLSDPAKPIDKYYVNDRLIKTVDQEGVETAYEYGEGGRISKSVLSRSGKDLDIFTYSYDDERNLTIIKDFSGVKKAYDKDNRIIYIEKDNKVYSYYYSQGDTAVENSNIEAIKGSLDDLRSIAQTNNLLRDTDLSTVSGTVDDKYTYNPGTNFAIEELTQFTDDDGNIIKYNSGNIVNITKPDGTVISDVVTDNGVVTGFKVTVGGVIYTIEGGSVREKKDPDGSIVKYYSNGWISSKQDPSGETVYIYETPMTLNGNGEGDTYYTHIDKTSDAITLKLDDGAAEGNFVSKPIEVNALDLRNITWQSTLPAGSSLAIVFRTTDVINEENVDASAWSAWSGEITSTGDISGMNIPVGKYLQYKVILRRGTATDSPAINLGSVNIDILSRLSGGNDPSLSKTAVVDGKTYVYDNEEKLQKLISDDITYTYTKEGKIESMLEPSGRITTFTYDDKDKTALVETIIVDASRELHYDALGRISKDIDSASGEQLEYFYNGDMVSVKTTFTVKQTSVDDFSGFTKDNVSITDYEGITRIHLDRTVPLDFGTGADGALVVKRGETLVLESREYNFESIHVEEGATLTIQKWNGTTGGELKIKCRGEVLIEGVVTVSYSGYRGGAGWVNGQQGESYYGIGSATWANNAGGGGGGWSSYAPELAGGGGGGGGYAYAGGYGASGTGGPGGYGGSAYGDITLTDFFMGSGGGGGGGSNNWFGYCGGPGGNGGGKVQIMAPIITVSGSISADGGDGITDTRWNISSGGGGSGGSVILSGEQVSLVGNVTASGGYGGVVGNRGGDGSSGRIRVDYGVKEGEIFPGSSAINSPSIYYNQLTYVSEGTLTSEAIAIDSSATGSEATGYINANLDIPILSNIKIETRTGPSSDVNDTAAWSEWTETTLDQFGYKVNSPLTGYIQYRVKLMSREEDKTPSIYALNDFAIKFTLTNMEHLSKDAVSYSAPAQFVQPTLPVISEEPLIRIESINVGGVELSEADKGALVTAIQPLLSGQIASLVDTVYGSILTGSEPIVTKYGIDAKGGMKAEYVQKMDGSIEHYDEDGNARFVTDSTGAILTRYYRNEAGDLEDVRLLTERARLDHEITTAENSILTKKIEDLQKLADQVGAAHSDLDAQVSDVQAQIDSARAEIEAFRFISYQTQVQSMFGAKNVTVVIENPYYAQMMARVDLAERKFKDNAALSYFSLANMQNVSKGRIEAATMEALANLKRQRDITMVQLLRKELTTLIYDCYIKYLGRLPSTQELNDLIESLASKSAFEQDTYTLDIAALKADLENRPDRVGRVSEINDIVLAVKDTINSYLASSDKDVLVSALGLSGEQIVDLTAEDWSRIVEWLDYNQQNTMHFGQSAFLVLKELVDDYYSAHPELANSSETSHQRYVRLASNAILIDILTGVINPFTEGDLLLSLFAMSKTAQIEGLDLQAYKLDWEDLVGRTADYIQTGREKVIVHMNSNHYVTVVSIDAENNVTYYEPNMGVDGETLTVSKSEFMKIWKGYSLSSRAPPEAAKKLSSMEAQRIRGADIFLVISIILSIVSFALSFIDNEFCQILSKILAITALVIGGIDILVSLYNTFNALATGMVTFKELFTMSFANVGNFFAQTLPNFLAKAAVTPLLAAVDVAMVAVDTVIHIAQAVTIQRGLEFLGVDPSIARIASSFVSAGTNSFLQGSSLAFNLGGAFTGLIVSGVSQLSNVLGAPPEISNLIGISAGTLFSAGLTGFGAGIDVGGVVINGVQGALISIGNAFSTTILPNIVSELAYLGIQQVGEMLGVDPRISYLAGMGIRNMINPGIDAKGNPRTMWDGIQQGLLQGVASIGINYATQELGLNPLLANIGFSAISSAINAGLAATMGEVDPITGKRPDIFKTIFNTYKNNALTFLSHSEAPDKSDQQFWTPSADGTQWNFNQSAYNSAWGNYHWQQAAYTAQILDFSDIVKEQGLIDALNAYGTGFFNAIAVNQIVQSGVTLGEYFDDKLNLGDFIWKTINNKLVAAVDTPTQSDGGHSTGFFEWVLDEGGVNGVWDPLGMGETKENGDTFWGIGEIGEDGYAGMGFYDDTTMYNDWGDLDILQTIDNGNQTYAEIKDNTGKTIFVVEPTVDGGYNYYDSYGDYVDANINDYLTGYSYSFDDSVLDKYNIFDSVDSTNLWTSDFSNLSDIFIGGTNLDLDYSYETKLTSDQLSLVYNTTNAIIENSQLKEPSQLTIPGASDFAGNYEDVQGKIDTLNDIQYSLTAEKKEITKELIRQWSLDNKGVIPNVELVVKKQDWLEIPLYFGSYTTSTDITSTFKGHNSNVTIKVDPWTGTVTPIEINTDLTLYDKYNTDFGIQIQQKYTPAQLLSTGVDVGMYANYKLGDKSIASNATSFGFDLTGSTILSYNTSSIADYDPGLNISNSHEFKINNKRAAMGIATVLVLLTRPEMTPALRELLRGALAAAVAKSAYSF